MVPNSEVANEELVKILQQLQKYVPLQVNGDQKDCMLAGDQLTAERVRNVQLIRATSDISCQKLDCFTPAHTEWHTSVTLLQVSTCIHDACHFLKLCMHL